MNSEENKSLNLETFEYVLSADWADFIAFCSTPMTEKEVDNFWNED